MQKGLCITALSISGLVLLLFLADLLMGLAGMRAMAPFKYFAMIWDIVFVVGSGLVAYMSFVQFRKLP